MSDERTMLGGENWKIIREDERLPNHSGTHASSEGSDDLRVSSDLFDFLESLRTDIADRDEALARCRKVASEAERQLLGARKHYNELAMILWDDRGEKIDIGQEVEPRWSEPVLTVRTEYADGSVTEETEGTEPERWTPVRRSPCPHQSKDWRCGLKMHERKCPPHRKLYPRLRPGSCTIFCAVKDVDHD